MRSAILNSAMPWDDICVAPGLASLLEQAVYHLPNEWQTWLIHLHGPNMHIPCANQHGTLFGAAGNGDSSSFLGGDERLRTWLKEKVQDASLPDVCRRVAASTWKG